MLSMILLALLTLAPLIADAGGTAHCTTREDPAFKRWVTECSDGARAIRPSTWLSPPSTPSDSPQDQRSRPAPRCGTPLLTGLGTAAASVSLIALVLCGEIGPGIVHDEVVPQRARGQAHVPVKRAEGVLVGTPEPLTQLVA
jgi:hypothetical protein